MLCNVISYNKSGSNRYHINLLALSLLASLVVWPLLMIERLGSDYKVMKGAVTPDHEMKSDDDGTRLAASFYTPHTLHILARAAGDSVSHA